MKWAIAIGCYKLHQFVELCVCRCIELFGEDVPIILVDDLSEHSPKIEWLAGDYGCSYIVGNSRKSHFSGDMQAFITGLKFCEEVGADALLKLSQRFVPVLPEFRKAAENAFADPNIQVCCPGRPPKNQIARPQARFYTKFGILTDVLAIRRGAISPEDLLAIYRERVAKPCAKSDSFAETTWGYLLAERFAGRHRLLDEWTRHVPFKPKIYLRKSQSTQLDYQKVAKMENVQGDWDLREWGGIEQKAYMAKPTRA